MDIITTSGCYLKSNFISDRFLSIRVEIRNEFYILRNEYCDIELKKGIELMFTSKMLGCF